MDLWGPSPVTILCGHRYYVSFTDDKTCLTYLHLLKHKSDTLNAYKDFEANCKTQHKANVKVLHSDCGGEYTRKEFVMHLKWNGTKQKLTVHDTPENNGVAERLNCTILEKIRTMLHASGQPEFLWGEAAHHVVWLKNHTPTKALGGLTPFEVAYSRKPDLRGLREWGSCIWVRNESKSKLGGHVNEGVWVVLDNNSKGAQVFWPTKRTVMVERNIYFDKSATTDHLEGEDYVTIKTPAASKASSTSNSYPIAVALEITETSVSNNAPTPQQPLPKVQTPEPEVDPQPAPRKSCTRMPSKRVQDILAGIGVTLNCRSDPTLTPGIQAPSLPPPVERSQFEGEGISEQMISVLKEVLMDCNEELAMVAEIAEAEALEPSSLADARRRPDWSD